MKLPKIPKALHTHLLAVGIGMVLGAIFKSIIMLGIGVMVLGGGLYAYQTYLK